MADRSSQAMFVAKGIAVGRVLFGIGCMAAPRQMTAPAGKRAEGTMVAMTRTFGVRDLVLGAGALMTLGQEGADGIRWLEVGATADTLDVANALVFKKDLEPLGFVATMVIASGAAAGGWWAAHTLRAAR